MRSLILLSCLVLTSLTYAGAPPPERTDFDHADFDAILFATVSDGLVDYAAIRDEHFERLEGYLERLDRFDLHSLSAQQRLAALINLYNATMLRVVVERLAPDYSPAADEFRVFDEPLVHSGGKRFSLNRLEHEIIRHEFNEPRIHVALVCAARSCPPLLPRAYRAADLDRVLEQNMRRFVNDGVRNRIDFASRELRLSHLFDWYAEDFGGPQAVASYVDRYVDEAVSGFEVSFLDYSWELNAR